jgi:hypothetical protein
VRALYVGLEMNLTPKTKCEWQRLLLLATICPFATLTIARKIALEYYGSFRDDSSGYISQNVIYDYIHARRILDAIQNGVPEVILILSFIISFSISTIYLFTNLRLGLIGYGLLIIFITIHWHTPYILRG